MSNIPNNITNVTVTKKIDGVEVFLEDDPYLLELHKRLVEARNERKTAETHSQMLVNRLKLLKGEEEKSQKDVESIKTKYKKKYDTIKQIEEDLKQKMEFKAMKEVELEKQRDFNKTMKMNINGKIKEKREEHIKELIKEMIRLKEVKKQNDDISRHIKIEEQNTNKNKYEFIKNQKMLCEEKKRARLIEKKNHTRESLETKILKEKELKENIEEKNKQLGEEEIELMKKIKTTTMLHEKWSQELEKIDKKKTELAATYKTKLKGYKPREISLNFDKPQLLKKKSSTNNEDDSSKEEKKSLQSVENKYKMSSSYQSPKKQFFKQRLNTLQNDKEEELEENPFAFKTNNTYQKISEKLTRHTMNNIPFDSKAVNQLEKIRKTSATNAKADYSYILNPNILPKKGIKL